MVRKAGEPSLEKTSGTEGVLPLVTGRVVSKLKISAPGPKENTYCVRKISSKYSASVSSVESFQRALILV